MLNTDKLLGCSHEQDILSLINYSMTAVTLLQAIKYLTASLKLSNANSAFVILPSAERGSSRLQSGQVVSDGPNLCPRLPYVTAHV